ncbi:MAG: nitroreductase family protein [Bacteroidaceae bacterium]
MKTTTLFMIAGLMLAGCNTEKTQTVETSQDTTNVVTETIMARRSIRHYTSQTVSRDTLQKLAEYGVNAPNARNMQEWAIRIVDDQKYLQEVTELMKAAMPAFVANDDPKFRNGFRNATAVYFIAAPDDGHGMNMINLGALCQNICLAAQSMGLGSVVMGGPIMFMNTSAEAKSYLERLNLPEGYQLRICVGVGYPDEEPEAKPRDLSKIEFVE